MYTRDGEPTAVAPGLVDMMRACEDDTPSIHRLCTWLRNGRDDSPGRTGTRWTRNYWPTVSVSFRPSGYATCPPTYSTSFALYPRWQATQTHTNTKNHGTANTRPCTQTPPPTRPPVQAQNTPRATATLPTLTNRASPSPRGTTVVPRYPRRRRGDPDISRVSEGMHSVR